MALFHQFIGKLIQKNGYWLLLILIAVRSRLCKPHIYTSPNVDKVHISDWLPKYWFFYWKYSFFFSFDTRKSAIENGTHWFDQNFLNGRGRFDARARPAIFAMDAVRITDTGLYRCRVDFQKTPTRNSKVNLTVIGEL